MPFRAVTLNLEQDHKRWAMRRPLILEEIVRLAPDLIAFNEVCIPLQSARDLRDAAAEQTGHDYTLVQQTRVNSLSKAEDEALLTRCPVIETGNFDYQARDMVALIARVLVHGTPLDVYVTHLFMSRGDDALRLFQVQQLLAWIGSRGDVPGSIVCGDFNASLEAPSAALMATRFRPTQLAPTAFTPLADHDGSVSHPYWPRMDRCIDYLVFECLAERTIARENLARSRDPELGYAPSLHERMKLVLPACIARNIRIVSNMGAANPAAGARAMRHHARELGLREVSCAVVVGDDVGEIVRRMPELPLMETGEPLETLLPRMVSANAYLGADTVKAALDTGADVVLTGRVADPSLFLGTVMHHFDWDYQDWPRLAAGTIAGHLLECSGSVTGGCFAWPGRKEVEGLARLGFPFADVTDDGTVHIGKPEGSGGRVDVMTCTEQLIYEMHDPANYITPDCVLDITGVTLHQDGKDRVRVEGMRAKPRTGSYKVTIGYFDGWIGEGEVSYAGPDAVARARLGGDIVRERLQMRGFSYDDFRIDLIGMSSLHGALETRPVPYEVRLRVAGRAEDRKAAHAVGFEVRTLHVNGPGSAGGGMDPRVRQVLAVKSVLLPRRYVNPQILWRARYECRADVEGVRPRPLPCRRQGQHVEYLGHRL